MNAKTYAIVSNKVFSLKMNFIFFQRWIIGLQDMGTRHCSYKDYTYCLYIFLCSGLKNHFSVFLVVQY
jgi:hypothetical protein